MAHKKHLQLLQALTALLVPLVQLLAVPLVQLLAQLLM
jgi:hypothetical protein